MTGNRVPSAPYCQTQIGNKKSLVIPGLFPLFPVFPLKIHKVNFGTVRRGKGDRGRSLSRVMLTNVDIMRIPITPRLYPGDLFNLLGVYFLYWLVFASGGETSRLMFRQPTVELNM